ncbi:SusC/RagA family TonB-linked outer membrane protein [Halalkalibaculum sp. DA384]|uniref:SusC/RagA family TonB-linked outer membrane protein n=1 Tax=Halalkalibaculum sp. DA384 TaxID=3373606 RepID=UPI0037552ED2
MLFVACISAGGAFAQDSQELLVDLNKEVLADIQDENAASGKLMKIVQLEEGQHMLREVLQDIARQAELKLTYSEQITPLTETFTVEEPKQLTAKQALWKVLEETSLRFGISPTGQLFFFERMAEGKAPIQLETVSGQVTDAASGEPLPGVNVVVKGTTTGTSTDSEGGFELGVPTLQDTLVFSFIGYQTQEVPINGRTSIDVVLQTQAVAGDEVVVVGYGTQREQTLSGSISSVNVEEMEKVSTPTVGQAMMGRTPGVLFTNPSSHPGRPEMDISIRGFGDPLIIVDDNPVSKEYFQELSSNDIESISVLKDASAAAVYGARAGNGVIVVETKQGLTQPPQFSFSSNASWQFEPNPAGVVGSPEYAEMENVALWNEGREPIWTQEEIQLFRSGTDPNYPNNNYRELVIEDYAPQFRNNLSVRGGSEDVTYFVSGEMFNQDGILKSDDINYNRYSLRSNLDIDLTDQLSFGINLSVINREYFGPSTEADRAKSDEGLGPESIMMRIWRARPYCREDHFDEGDTFRLRAHCGGVAVSPTVLMNADWVGFYDWTELYGFGKANLEYDLSEDLLPGLAIGAEFDFGRRYFRQKEHHKRAMQYDRDPETGEFIPIRAANAQSRVVESRAFENELNQKYRLRYENEFNQHDVSVLALYERLSESTDSTRASRRRYILDKPYLFAGPDRDKDNFGTAFEGGRVAYVGRVNYSYADKYLLEVSGRIDASPNFPPDSRWGYFPSASIGWRLSEEPFISENESLSFIDDLKLRVSHGKLGFDAAGAYQYLSTFDFSNPYLYTNGQLTNSLASGPLVNPNITWETMYTSNFGIDFDLFDNQVQGSVDYFYRLRKDVLGSRIQEIPDVVGAELPQENYQKYDDRGIEASASYNYQTTNYGFSIGGNITWSRRKTLITDQPDFSTMEEYRRENLEGEWTDRDWVWMTDGLFTSNEEINNYGVDIDGRNNATIRPGDLKYIDYNGDGRITEADQIVSGGGQRPDLLFGFDLSVNWKGFQLGTLWQGATGYNINMMQSSWSIPFRWGDSPRPKMYTDSYVPEGQPWMDPNTDADALYPRFRTCCPTDHPSWQNGSDHWLVDGSYLRLKNVELSYNLSEPLLSQLGLRNANVSLGGYNIYTFFFADFPMEEFGDPEVITGTGNFTGYPTLGSYQIGINLGF